MIKFASLDTTPRGEHTNDEFRANPSNQHKLPGGGEGDCKGEN